MAPGAADVGAQAYDVMAAFNNLKVSNNEFKSNAVDSLHTAEANDCAALAHVLGIGTANPDRIVEQQDFARDFVGTLNSSARVTDLTRKITKSCGISTRHLAITHDIYANNPNLTTFGAPSLNDRVKLYESVGVQLGHDAAERALADWGGVRAAITHLITFSTSGMLCPGLDLRLIKSLGLPQNTKHMFVSYMGCHAGLLGLRAAAEIALADPKNRVLVVCSEVNSVNAQAPDPLHPVNNIIVDIIFGDGAAGLIVGAHPSKQEVPIYEIHRTATSCIPDCEEAITARLTCQGLDVGLSKDVPKLVAKAVDPFVKELVGDGIDYEKDLLWAVHPGGKAIVDATEKGCKLSPGKLDVSREILDRYSNMASATVLFVLDKVRKDNAGANMWTLALAFGPGISVEGAFMRLVA